MHKTKVRKPKPNSLRFIYNLENQHSFSVGGFGSETDTKIEPWFRFQIPKPNFGLTLLQTYQIVTNNDQMFILCLSYFFTAVKKQRIL